MLAHYLQHARALDRFTPVKLAAEFDIPVPDPRTANKDLRGPNGQELKYTGKIPMLVIDESDRYWIFEHRLATPGPCPSSCCASTHGRRRTAGPGSGSTWA